MNIHIGYLYIVVYQLEILKPRFKRLCVNDSLYKQISFNANAFQLAVICSVARFESLEIFIISLPYYTFCHLWPLALILPL